MADAVEFTAPCPRGHAGARWSAALRTVVGEACDDYLGAQRPQYAVDCAGCTTDRDPGPSPEPGTHERDRDRGHAGRG